MGNRHDWQSTKENIKFMTYHHPWHNPRVNTVVSSNLNVLTAHHHPQGDCLHIFFVSLPGQVCHYQSCLHDSRLAPEKKIWWDWCTLTSSQLLKRDAWSFSVCCFQRTQQPALISMTTTRTLSPDTTPPMKTSKYDCGRSALVVQWLPHLSHNGSVPGSARDLCCRPFPLSLSLPVSCRSLYQCIFKLNFFFFKYGYKCR